jgi:hypothetical protein
MLLLQNNPPYREMIILENTAVKYWFFRAMCHVFSHSGSNPRSYDHRSTSRNFLGGGGGNHVLEGDASSILMIEGSVIYPEEGGNRFLLSLMRFHPRRPMILLFISVRY